jgi:hypothetical protein
MFDDAADLHSACSCMQDLYDTLLECHFTNPKHVRYDGVVKSSLDHFDGDTECRSMLLDTATVFYGRNAVAAACAWKGMYKHAVTRLQHLYKCSLIKVVDGTLWMDDMIKSVAIKHALADNDMTKTRVWRHEQVRCQSVFYLRAFQGTNNLPLRGMYMFLVYTGANVLGSIYDPAYEQSTSQSAFTGRSL